MADVQFIQPKAPSVFDPTADLDVKRKRKLAEALMKQGAQPDHTEVISGVAVKQSPLGAFARAMTQGVAGYQEGQADRQDAQASKDKQQRFADAIGKYQTDPASAAQSLMMGSPEEQAMAFGMDKSELDYKRDLAKEQRGYAQAQKLASMKTSLGAGGGATGALADRLIAQGVDPIAAILIAKSGVDHNTRIDGATMSPMAGGEATAEAMAGAKEQGQKTVDLNTAAPIAAQTALGKVQGETAGSYAKKDVQAQDNEQVIAQILQKDKEGKDLLDKATGSGLGAMGAKVKQFGGVSDASTQANSQLEIFGGQLLNNVPRMEGPQSDSDLKSYREQAGKIADKSVPAGDKRAALQAINQIRQKYAHLNLGNPPVTGSNIIAPVQQAPMPNQAPVGVAPQGVDPRLWQHMTPEERQLFQQ